MYVAAAYGPLAPLVVFFVLAVPPLVAVSGWPWWVKTALIALDAGLLLGGAIWMGPKVLVEVRAAMEAERRG